jgi:hypothetical protein
VLCCLAWRPARITFTLGSGPDRAQPVKGDPRLGTRTTLSPLPGPLCPSVVRIALEVKFKLFAQEQTWTSRQLALTEQNFRLIPGQFRRDLGMNGVAGGKAPTLRDTLRCLPRSLALCVHWTIRKRMITGRPQLRFLDEGGFPLSLPMATSWAMPDAESGSTTSDRSYCGFAPWRPALRKTTHGGWMFSEGRRRGTCQASWSSSGPCREPGLRVSWHSTMPASRPAMRLAEPGEACLPRWYIRLLATPSTGGPRDRAGVPAVQ